MNCFKVHKENCNDEKTEQIYDGLNNEQIEGHNPNKPLYLDEYQDIIVDQTKLSGLKENNSIMTKLRNKKLQRIIKEIDSTKYKKKSLEKMMGDKDFKDFVDEILISLGYLKDNLFVYP